MATDKLPAQGVVKEDAPAAAVQKKPYSRPTLTIYGHVSKLTMTGVGSGTDGGPSSKRMKNCL
jgi:hypothetical protein